jgi:hypothetical protein
MSPTSSASPTPFGCASPYAEPLWYSRNTSPYYNDSHRRLRAAVRQYVDEEILPYAFDWEQAGQVPDKVCWKRTYTVHHSLKLDLRL